jgi:hypothetical protein
MIYSDQYSGPDYAFPHGDARLDLTDKAARLERETQRGVATI